MNDESEEIATFLHEVSCLLAEKAPNEFRNGIIWPIKNNLALVVEATSAIVSVYLTARNQTVTAHFQSEADTPSGTVELAVRYDKKHLTPAIIADKLLEMIEGSVQ